MTSPIRSLETMAAYQWQPISPLSDSIGYDFSEIDALQRQWVEVKDTGAPSARVAHDAFLERLTRRWAIETGIIEGLYTLDRGVTETLVARGISADLIEQNATNKDPNELARMLEDHQTAMHGIYAEIREDRPLSRSAIRQMHTVLTHSQRTFQAMDQFGRRFDARLRHGDFKSLENNPTRNDGTIHEYCPPEHVDSELENLLRWYHQYTQDLDGCHPLLTAAWLHHRFTQIHPFQDGNGRVVRALLTWHLVREGYLPVVVKRDDRNDYINALESADHGDLTPFVDLLVRLERRTILEALGEPESIEPLGLVDQVLDHIVEQIGRKNADREARMRSVNTVAVPLREHASTLLTTRADQIVSRLERAGRSVTTLTIAGGPGDREHWYSSQVVQTANNSGHWVNLNESRFFVRLTLTPDRTSRQPRLVFVISLHHTGRQLSGVMAATAFSLIDHYAGGVSEQVEESEASWFTDCTLEPFTFTGEHDADILLPRFTSRIEQCLATAVRQWGEYLA